MLLWLQILRGNRHIVMQSCVLALLLLVVALLLLVVI
jgi:hypothetical protein